MSWRAKYNGVCHSIDCPLDHVIEAGQDCDFDGRNRTIHSQCWSAVLDPFSSETESEHLVFAGGAPTSGRRDVPVCSDCHVEHPPGECW